MGNSNKFWKSINVLIPVVDFVYLLQMEEFYSQFYVRQLPHFFWRRNIQRLERLDWTGRVKLTVILSLCLSLLPVIGVVMLIMPMVVKVAIIFLVSLFSWVWMPGWVLLANLMLGPLIDLYKQRIQAKAAAYFAANFSDKQVIAITGSYGKTTCKNFIRQMLEHSYRVQVTPGNINTPIGIANWVLADLRKDAEVLIIEMDADYRGKVAACCQITPPSIGVITSVGDQHLSRLGGRSKLANELLVLFRNIDNPQHWILGRETAAELRQLLDVSFEWTEIKPDIEMPDLSASSSQNLQLAVAVARIVGVEERFLQHSIVNLDLPQRRQRQEQVGEFTVIDDSYNISLDTAAAGLDRARQVADQGGKKLVVITGGIPELDTAHADSNTKLGMMLTEQADAVVLLDTRFAEDIAAGLSMEKVNARLNSMQAAWKHISSNFQAEEWVVLMQPELTDLYY